jgi:hypothetical protein
MARVLAEAGDEHLHIAIREAPPITLHGRTCWRTDGNSPVTCASSSKPFP